MKTTPRYLIALGSSHEQGFSYLTKSLQLIINSDVISFHGQSRIYQNCSEGTLQNYLFHNCVLAVRSHLAPHSFYRELHMFQHQLGRIRTFRNAPRTIDIDVLMSLDLTYTSAHFFVPHQSLHARNFFVIPAIEALRSARWPLPQDIFKSSLNFGKAYLKPLTS